MVACMVHARLTVRPESDRMIATYGTQIPIQGRGRPPGRPYELGSGSGTPDNDSSYGLFPTRAGGFRGRRPSRRGFNRRLLCPTRRPTLHSPTS
jgi:hypothetical protein